VNVYDPIADGYSYAPLEELVKGADCLVVLVEHTVIRKELEKKEAEIRKAMRNPLIIRFYP
jgi:hypothetical protein